MKEQFFAALRKLPLVRSWGQREREQLEKMKADPGAHLDTKAWEFLRNALIISAGRNKNEDGIIGFEPHHKDPLSWADEEQKQKACGKVRTWLEGDYRKLLGQEEIDAAMARLEARVLGTN